MSIFIIIIIIGKIDLYDFVVCVCSWYYIWSRYQENSRRKYKEDNRNSKLQLRLSYKKWILELRLCK